MSHYLHPIHELKSLPKSLSPRSPSQALSTSNDIVFPIGGDTVICFTALWAEFYPIKTDELSKHDFYQFLPQTFLQCMGTDLFNLIQILVTVDAIDAFCAEGVFEINRCIHYSYHSQMHLHAQSCQLLIEFMQNMSVTACNTRRVCFADCVKDR